MNMRKIALIGFIVLGIADILYGFFMNDRVSLVLGTVLIVLGVFIIVRDRRQAAE